MSNADDTFTDSVAIAQALAQDNHDGFSSYPRLKAASRQLHTCKQGLIAFIDSIEWPADLNKEAFFLAIDRSDEVRNLFSECHAALKRLYPAILMNQNGLEGTAQTLHTLNNILLVLDVLETAYLTTRLAVDINNVITHWSEDSADAILLEYGADIPANAIWLTDGILSILASLGKINPLFASTSSFATWAQSANILCAPVLSGLAMLAFATEHLSAQLRYRHIKRKSDACIQNARNDVVAYLLESGELPVSHLLGRALFGQGLSLDVPLADHFKDNADFNRLMAQDPLFQLLIEQENITQAIRAFDLDSANRQINKTRALFIGNALVAGGFTGGHALIASGLTLAFSGALPPLAIATVATAAVAVISIALMSAVAAYFGDDKKEAKKRETLDAKKVDIENKITAIKVARQPKTRDVGTSTAKNSLSSNEASLFYRSNTAQQITSSAQAAIAPVAIPVAA